MMFAAGVPARVLFVGSTFRALGATPNVHIIIEPVVTSCPIIAFTCNLTELAALKATSPSARAAQNTICPEPDH